jgi:Clp amino terminal domain, pathogenicity island component
MMLERFTPDARAVIKNAVEHAGRLGHRYVGGEHLLLAAVSTSQPASAVLCAHGVTPERVEGEIVRRVGLGAGAGLFGGLDRDALASIGIDIDAVRARIESSFGPQALSAAAWAVHRETRRRRPGPVRSWRRRTRRSIVTPLAPEPALATGRYQAPGPLPHGRLPFTPVARKILELSLREAVARHDAHIGIEHIALALSSVKRGMVPSILATAGVPESALRAEISERYRQAS